MRASYFDAAGGHCPFHGCILCRNRQIQAKRHFQVPVRLHQSQRVSPPMRRRCRPTDVILQRSVSRGCRSPFRNCCSTNGTPRARWRGALCRYTRGTRSHLELPGCPIARRSSSVMPRLRYSGHLIPASFACPRRPARISLRSAAPGATPSLYPPEGWSLMGTAAMPDPKCCAQAFAQQGRFESLLHPAAMTRTPTSRQTAACSHSTLIVRAGQGFGSQSRTERACDAFHWQSAKRTRISLRSTGFRSQRKS